MSKSAGNNLYSVNFQGKRRIVSAPNLHALKHHILASGHFEYAKAKPQEIVQHYTEGGSVEEAQAVADEG